MVVSQCRVGQIGVKGSQEGTSCNRVEGFLNLKWFKSGLITHSQCI